MKMMQQCPFCGDNSVRSMILLGVEGFTVRIVCQGCYANGPSKETEELAWLAWERRIPPIDPMITWSTGS